MLNDHLVHTSWLDQKQIAITAQNTYLGLKNYFFLFICNAKNIDTKKILIRKSAEELLSDFKSDIFEPHTTNDHYGFGQLAWSKIGFDIK